MTSEYEVETTVRLQRGRWAVYLLVTTPDGVEERHLTDYSTEATAKLMADVVRRTAARRRPPRPEANQ